MHQFAKQQKAGKNSTDFQPSLILGGSLAGYMDIPAVPIYNTSKFAVRGLLQALKHTAPRIKARVGLIAPWHVDTPMLAEAVAYLKGQGIRMALIEDVFAAAERLATDQDSNGKYTFCTVHASCKVADVKQGDAMPLCRERSHRKAISMLTKRAMRSSGKSTMTFSSPKMFALHLASECDLDSHAVA